MPLQSLQHALLTALALCLRSAALEHGDHGQAGIELLAVQASDVNFATTMNNDDLYPSDSSETAMIVSLCLVIPILASLYWKRLKLARLCLGLEDEQETNFPLNGMDLAGRSTQSRPQYVPTSNSPDLSSPETDTSDNIADPFNLAGRRPTAVEKAITVPPNVRTIQSKQLKVSIPNYGCSETGKVYVAEWKHEGETLQVLVKELELSLLHRAKAIDRARGVFEKQLSLLASIKHENILQLLAFAEGDDPCQVLEFPALGCLNIYLGKASVLDVDQMPQESTDIPLITRQDMLKLAIDACTAVAHLTSIGFAHGNIAARHCFVTGEKRLKLACHEYTQQSSRWEYESLPMEQMVAIRWSAPEILNQTMVASQETDIWSLGVLMWEIFAKGKLPFKALSMDEIMQNVMKGAVHEQPEFANAAVYAVMLRCWNLSPDARPKAFDIASELRGLDASADDATAGQNQLEAARSATTDSREEVQTDV